jgi:EAL domain-containing protein (putative c-di-GMP-specific phosphodiesterase class I)
VGAALIESGLDPDLLELEITETVVMQDAEATIATLRRLKNMGVRISVDDFGTGYSSLSYLKRFPIDVLKIDRSFLARVHEDCDNQAIVRTIIALAKSLKLAVVAEGVETQQQFDFLRDLGCDRAQGYLLGRPTTPEVLQKLPGLRTSGPDESESA